MEKNIAAMMREDARTVEVVFQEGGQLYTYVTDIELKQGDYVVVFARTELKVATVVAMHDSVQISPGDSIRYSWVVCKVDLERYNRNKENNERIERVVLEKYKENIRRTFAQQIMSGMSVRDQRSLQRLLKGEPS